MPINNQTAQTTTLQREYHCYHNVTGEKALSDGNKKLAL